eukprot:3033150-Pleurochrysis_carterae.AAC.6
MIRSQRLGTLDVTAGRSAHERRAQSQPSSCEVSEPDAHADLIVDAIVAPDHEVRVGKASPASHFRCDGNDERQATQSSGLPPFGTKPAPKAASKPVPQASAQLGQYSERQDSSLTRLTDNKQTATARNSRSSSSPPVQATLSQQSDSKKAGECSPGNRKFPTSQEIADAKTRSSKGASVSKGDEILHSQSTSSVDVASKSKDNTTSALLRPESSEKRPKARKGISSTTGTSKSPQVCKAPGEKEAAVEKPLQTRGASSALNDLPWLNAPHLERTPFTQPGPPSAQIKPLPQTCCATGGADSCVQGASESNANKSKTTYQSGDQCPHSAAQHPVIEPQRASFSSRLREQAEADLRSKASKGCAGSQRDNAQAAAAGGRSGDSQSAAGRFRSVRSSSVGAQGKRRSTSKSQAAPEMERPLDGSDEAVMVLASQDPDDGLAAKASQRTASQVSPVSRRAPSSRRKMQAAAAKERPAVAEAKASQRHRPTSLSQTGGEMSIDVGGSPAKASPSTSSENERCGQPQESLDQLSSSRVFPASESCMDAKPFACAKRASLSATTEDSGAVMEVPISAPLSPKGTDVRGPSLNTKLTEQLRRVPHSQAALASGAEMDQFSSKPLPRQADKSLYGGEDRSATSLRSDLQHICDGHPETAKAVSSTFGSIPGSKQLEQPNVSHAQELHPQQSSSTSQIVAELKPATKTATKLPKALRACRSSTEAAVQKAYSGSTEAVHDSFAFDDSSRSEAVSDAACRPFRGRSVVGSFKSSATKDADASLKVSETHDNSSASNDQPDFQRKQSTSDILNEASNIKHRSDSPSGTKRIAAKTSQKGQPQPCSAELFQAAALQPSPSARRAPSTRRKAHAAVLKERPAVAERKLQQKYQSEALSQAADEMSVVGAGSPAKASPSSSFENVQCGQPQDALEEQDQPLDSLLHASASCGNEKSNVCAKHTSQATTSDDARSIVGFPDAETMPLSEGTCSKRSLATRSAVMGKRKTDANAEVLPQVRATPRMRKAAELTASGIMEADETDTAGVVPLPVRPSLCGKNTAALRTATSSDQENTADPASLVPSSMASGSRGKSAAIARGAAGYLEQGGTRVAADLPLPAAPRLRTRRTTVSAAADEAKGMTRGPVVPLLESVATEVQETKSMVVAETLNKNQTSRTNAADASASSSLIGLLEKPADATRDLAHSPCANEASAMASLPAPTVADLREKTAVSAAIIADKNEADAGAALQRPHRTGLRGKRAAVSQETACSIPAVDEELDLQSRAAKATAKILCSSDDNKAKLVGACFSKLPSPRVFSRARRATAPPAGADYLKATAVTTPAAERTSRLQTRSKAKAVVRGTKEGQNSIGFRAEGDPAVPSAAVDDNANKPDVADVAS